MGIDLGNHRILLSLGGKGEKMTLLCREELERFEEDLQNNEFIGVEYLDTWEYEDEYSHNEIELSREQFIKEANEILKQNNYPYVMREVCENARICDKKTGDIIR